MHNTDKALIARTLKECVGYLLKDCEDAGFNSAAIHLRIAVDELRAAIPEVENDAPILRHARN